MVISIYVIQTVSSLMVQRSKKI